MRASCTQRGGRYPTSGFPHYIALLACGLLIAWSACGLAQNTTKMSTTTPPDAVVQPAPIPPAVTPAPAGPSKEDLEKRKLELETKALQNPWKNPQTLLGGASVLLAIVATLVTVISAGGTVKRQKEEAELKITKAEIDTKTAQLNAREAEIARQKAEADARAAEQRASAAKEDEVKATARIKRAQLLMGKIAEVQLDPAKKAKVDYYQLQNELSEVIFNISITPVDNAPVVPNDNAKLRTYQITSEPPGLDVYLVIAHVDDQGFSSVSSHIIRAIHTGEEPSVGRTPCVISVPYGNHYLSFYREREHQFATSVDVK